MKLRQLQKTAAIAINMACLLGIYMALQPTPALANTVYLVRHAEKHTEGKDPALTACGQARTDALATRLAGVSASSKA
ncbi:hypothetical protein [Rheinheimera baltica]|uniref:Histidine phosphatase family protein n=1 Tax=Rheinheimera baltica TaxID=67576 RepID=A0ABT9I5C1_9GAMM|nr:hypothetical protein [Rheinheimera baltica]MDP5138597.1 hypothetical protein [Rheinheimera baltica]MDP5151346.1 hypothetical protein [Rheinheimera baltica]MDP5188912.1 hypothetical protein [Rheinheimera baltica]